MKAVKFMEKQTQENDLLKKILKIIRRRNLLFTIVFLLLGMFFLAFGILGMIISIYFERSGAKPFTIFFIFICCIGYIESFIFFFPVIKEIPSKWFGHKYFAKSYIIKSPKLKNSPLSEDRRSYKGRVYTIKYDFLDNKGVIHKRNHYPVLINPFLFKTYIDKLPIRVFGLNATIDYEEVIKILLEKGVSYKELTEAHMG